MGEHKYFEACLALKAAEEGLQLDSVMLSEAPSYSVPSGYVGWACNSTR